MKTVFVIDDSETAREILIDHLKSIGEFNICEAEDGKEAWDKINNFNQEIHLILCDQNMPHMLGMELLKLVKSHDLHRITPFVFVTSEGEEDSVIEALGEGADDYLTKPIEDEVLVPKLKTILL